MTGASGDRSPRHLQALWEAGRRDTRRFLMRDGKQIGVKETLDVKRIHRRAEDALAEPCRRFPSGPGCRPRSTFDAGFDPFDRLAQRLQHRRLIGIVPGVVDPGGATWDCPVDLPGVGRAADPVEPTVHQLDRQRSQPRGQGKQCLLSQKALLLQVVSLHPVFVYQFAMRCRKQGEAQAVAGAQHGQRGLPGLPLPSL